MRRHTSGVAVSAALSGRPRQKAQNSPHINTRSSSVKAAPRGAAESIAAVVVDTSSRIYHHRQWGGCKVRNLEQQYAV
jgi:hypothetical protein